MELGKKSNYSEQGFVPGVRASGVNKSQSERALTLQIQDTHIHMQTKHTLMHIFPGSRHKHTNSILPQIPALFPSHSGSPSHSLSHMHTQTHTRARTHAIPYPVTVMKLSHEHKSCNREPSQHSNSHLFPSFTFYSSPPPTFVFFVFLFAVAKAI